MRMNSKNKKQHSDLKMLNNFMSRGKISNAIRVLSDEHKGGVLALTNLIDGRPVIEILRDKLPEGQLLERNCIQSEHPRTLPYQPAFFDKIIARLVRKRATKTDGSAVRQISMLMTGVDYFLLSGNPPRTCASLLPSLLRG